jgi:hypothetical protein
MYEININIIDKNNFVLNLNCKISLIISLKFLN